MTEDQYRHITDALDIHTQELNHALARSRGTAMHAEVSDVWAKHMNAVVAFQDGFSGVYA